MRNPEQMSPKPVSEIMLVKIKAQAKSYDIHGSEFQAFSDWVDLMTAAGERNKSTEATEKEKFTRKIQRTHNLMDVRIETDENYAKSHTATRDLLVMFNFHWNLEKRKPLNPDKLDAVQPEAATKLQSIREELLKPLSS